MREPLDGAHSLQSLLGTNRRLQKAQLSEAGGLSSDERQIMCFRLLPESDPFLLSKLMLAALARGHFPGV